MAYPNTHRFFATLYVLLMGWVWLDPVHALTDTKDIWLFWCFLALFGVSRWLYPLAWLPPISTGMGLVGLLYVYYFRAWDFWSTDWLKAWGAELADSLPHLMMRDWLGMSPLARTFCFFLLLWVCCAVLWHYVFWKGRVFWFIVLSAVYLSVLDTFTPYDGRRSLTLTVVAGLAMLLWLRSFHVLPWEAGRFRVKWLAGGLALIVFVTSVAYAAPKPGPVWPDPIPWLVHGGATGPDNGTLRKVGYGHDDSRLGGAFIEDNTAVMQVRTTAPAYWRGESKDVYTGKGWLNSAVDRRSDRLLAVGEEVPADYVRLFNPAAVDVLPVWQHVQWMGDGLPQGRFRYPLFHQGMLTKVEQADVHMLVWGQEARGIYALQQPVTTALVQSVLPLVDEEQLRQTGQDYPADIRRRYLQLPAIPERVRQLAHELTADADHPYDKAKAIEAYLRSEEFAYDTRNVTIPEEDEDFVDQFLFESKRGYCDYFSTAMVVLLRSVGIPARWVKGFTAGELVQKTSPTDDEAWPFRDVPYYEGTIRQRHAHSWVEVYFSGIGWLPFEPTKGFALPSVAMAEDAGETEDDAEAPAEEAAPEEALDDVSETPEEERLPWLSSFERRAFSGWWAIVAAGLALMALVGWMCRDMVWFWWRLRRWWRPKVTPDVFMAGYRRLLRALERTMSREPTETLRDYLRRIGMDDALSEPTYWYEVLRYGSNEQKNINRVGQRGQWDEQLQRLYTVYRQWFQHRFSRTFF